MTVGERIFHLLEQKNMKQKELSELTGISTTSISNWRKRNTNPAADKILIIAKALNVSPEYLLSGITEEGSRANTLEYMVLPKGTEERHLIEMFGMLDMEHRKHLMEYVERLCDEENGGEM